MIFSSISSTLRTFCFSFIFFHAFALLAGPTKTSHTLDKHKADMSRKTYPLYPYSPSKAGAIIFAMLFFGTTCFHLFQMFKRRSWFMIVLIVGGYGASLNFPLTRIAHLN